MKHAIYAAIVALAATTAIPVAHAQTNPFDKCTTATVVPHAYSLHHDENIDQSNPYAEQWAAYRAYTVEALCALLAEVGKCHRDDLCTERACDIVSDYTWEYDADQVVIITPHPVPTPALPTSATMDVVIALYWTSPTTVSC